MEISNAVLSPGATSRATGVQVPSRMKKLVSGSKNCQPSEKFSGFHAWLDLFSTETRISSEEAWTRTWTSRYSAPITGITRLDSARAARLFCDPRRKFRRRADPGKARSVPAGDPPREDRASVPRGRGRFRAAGPRSRNRAAVGRFLAKHIRDCAALLLQHLLRSARASHATN